MNNKFHLMQTQGDVLISTLFLTHHPLTHEDHIKVFFNKALVFCPKMKVTMQYSMKHC